MANNNKVPSPVLPLPPLEYDAAYFNNLIRLLNYYIEQKDNPGLVRSSSVEVAAGTPASPFVVDPSAYTDGRIKVIMKGLPTSASGLESGQVWRDGNTVKVIP